MGPIEGDVWVWLWAEYWEGNGDGGGYGDGDGSGFGGWEGVGGGVCEGVGAELRRVWVGGLTVS